MRRSTYTYERIVNLDQTSKFLLAGYCVSVLFCFAGTVYTNGVMALNEYRAKHKKNAVPEEEFNIVAKACRKDAFSEFFESLIFYPVISSIMPRIVLGLNPGEKN